MRVNGSLTLLFFELMVLSSRVFEASRTRLYPPFSMNPCSSIVSLEKVASNTRLLSDLTERTGESIASLSSK